MKVLHIVNSLGFGGAEKLLVDLLPELNKSIYVEVLVITDKDDIYTEKLVSNGVKVISLKSKSVYNPTNILKLRKYIKSNSFDIIHVHLFPAQYWLGLFPRTIKKKNIKMVTTEHSNHNRRRNFKLFNILDKVVYKKYDKIISITNLVQQNLITWLDTTEYEKFKVINNGVKLTDYTDAKPYFKDIINPSFNNETKIVTMVGRFTEAKNQKTLIKAVNECITPFELLLVGDGALKSDMEDFTLNYPIKDRVHFLGFRKDVPRILKSSDLIVLSSNWEGLSLASIEAMASGVPLIASDVEGVTDIVSGAGVLFENNNYVQLANILDSLIEDIEKYNHISTKCINRSKEYDLNKMVKSTLELYFELCGG